MSANASETIRLIALLKMLTQTPGAPAYFADALGVDERTIRRRVQALRDAGFPIIVDKTTGNLELASDYGVPPIEFTEREALAMLVLFHETGDKFDGNLLASLRGAAAKLASTLSPALLDFVAATRPRLATKRGAVDKRRPFSPTANDETDDDERTVRPDDEKKRDVFFDAILEASVSRKSLAVRYKGPGVPTLTSTLCAYSVFYSRAWYVVGYSALHRETRTFKISRFTSVAPSDAKFIENLNFSLESYFGDAWRFVRGPKTYRVVVRFSAKVGLNVAEVRWHKTQRAQVFPDGSAELEFRVAGLTEIVWWVLGYGAEAEVVEPPELREMVAEHARRVLERLADPSPPSDGGFRGDPRRSF